MNKNSRLKEARIRAGLSQEELAKKLDVSTSYVTMIEKNKGYSYKRAMELAPMLNVSADWLYFDQNGDKKLDKNENYNIRLEARPFTLMPDREEFQGNDHKFAYSEEGIIAMRVRVVPAKAQLGYLRGFADPEYFESFDFEIIPISKEAKGTYLGFETVGPSMINLTTEQWAAKSIFPGRIAIGRELNREHWKNKLHIHSNDAWIIVHRTDGILLKEIIDHDKITGLIKIHSWNPDKELFPDETIHLDDVAQLFNVLQVIDKRR